MALDYMLHSNSVRRGEYREFSLEEQSIPLFSKGWWLDCLAGPDGWDVVIVKSNEGKIIGSMPYSIESRACFSILGQPPLTQKLGPWIRPYVGGYTKSLGYQKDVMNALVSGLPKYSSFRQYWHHSYTNCLPFYWNNFDMAVRYTYILKDISDIDELWAGLQGNIRGDIKKAKSRFHLNVRNDLGIEEFVKLNRMTYERQNLPLPYSDHLVADIDRVCASKDCRLVLIAEDEDGRRHAGVFVVWDENFAYYIMGGGDPELRNSGATSLCMWEAIRCVSPLTKGFDFEGSMLESVERFFRSFGAIQVPYYGVAHTPSLTLRTKGFAGDFFRAVASKR